MMQTGFNTIVTLKPLDAGRLMQYPLQNTQNPKIFVPPLVIKQSRGLCLTFRLRAFLKSIYSFLFKTRVTSLESNKL